MEWYLLERVQEIAYDQKKVICAWRPSNFNGLPNRYVWDKGAKVADFVLFSPHSIKVVVEKDGRATVFHPDGTISLKDYNPSEIPIKKEEKIMELAENSDRRKTPEKRKYRSMTFEEVKGMEYGDHPLILLNSGKVGQVKVNGKIRLWKRDPNRIEVPCKYGLRECFTFTARDIDRFLVEVK